MEEREYYFERGNKPCFKKSVSRGEICICEYVEGHKGECTQCPTWRMATLKEMETLPCFDKFTK
jgi:hypothetical protein